MNTHNSGRFTEDFTSPDHGRTDSYYFGKWQLNSIFAASETAGKRMADKDTLAHMMFEQVFREKGKYTSTAGSKG